MSYLDWEILQQWKANIIIPEPQTEHKTEFNPSTETHIQAMEPHTTTTDLAPSSTASSTPP